MYGQKDANGNEWLDGEEDAMRHCLWNAFMAQDGLVGPTYARKISRLHEAMNQNEPDTADMDFHNNEYGVQLYENGLADDATEAVASCDIGVVYNELIVLNPNPYQRRVPEGLPEGQRQLPPLNLEALSGS